MYGWLDRVARIVDELAKLPTRVIVLVAANMYYPNPVKLSHIVDIVSSIKNVSPNTIRSTVNKLRVSGHLTRRGTGYYVITPSGLAYIKYLWAVEGVIPDEVVSVPARNMRIKRKIVREDGTIDWVEI